MIKQLYIENIAVIERAEIQLMAGFNVLSGETGAGKSIIIDALGAVMGGRVSRELIRTGESRAVASALFTGLSPRAAAWAAEQGFEPEGGELLVRREIFADGRNSCKVNGRPAALAMLKTLGALLVSVHGQHDGQHLLNEALHIDYLDAYGELGETLAAYEGQYDALLQLNRQIKALSLSQAEKERLRIRLAEQLAELAEAGVRAGEEAELLERRAGLIHGERISEALAQALVALDGADEQPGALARLEAGERQLRAGQKVSAQLEDFAGRMAEMARQGSELSAQMSRWLAELEFSPGLLEETERRLEQIARLCKKHQVEADRLPEAEMALTQELEGLEDAGQSLEALNARYVALRGQVAESAGRLHALREAAAEDLRARIEAELRLLDMPSARFRAEIISTLGRAQARFTRRGTDSVRFLLTTNSGEELRPLIKVASGGELSRVMLALQSVLSRGEEHVTAVFDEIDAGVSGRAASRVGEKLYAVSRARQVLCVTHLPQIACLADHQHHIEKQDAGGRTFTRVSLLDREGRVRELARLAAGVHISKATLQSASQLLEAAESWKKS